MTGDTCGAVIGAIILIGLKYGANEANDRVSKNRAYGFAEKLIKEFQARNKSILCRDLLGFNIKADNYPEKEEIILKQCPVFIAVASEIFEEILRGEDDKIKK